MKPQRTFKQMYTEKRIEAGLWREKYLAKQREFEMLLTDNFTMQGRANALQERLDNSGGGE